MYLFLLALSACNPDNVLAFPEGNDATDDDPNADDDGDGLTNGEEAEYGTDPLDPDSDDDTYLDYDEIVENRDPLDPEDRIYIGYWPYNRYKSDIVDPGWASSSLPC